jgi:hypothetical protein
VECENLKRILAFLFVFLPLAAHAQFAQQSTFGGTAGGSANALTITIPNVVSMADLKGVMISLLPASNNTGATTVNVNSISNVTVDKISTAGLAALSGGEFVTGQAVELFYDGTEFVQWSPPQKIGHTTVIKSTPGSASFTVPSGVFWLYVTVVGGGGGSAAGYSGSSYASAGGAGGGVAEGWLAVTPAEVISYTVGAAGTAGTTGALPTAAGTTTFSTLSATGGANNSGLTLSVPLLGGTPGIGSGGDKDFAGAWGTQPFASTNGAGNIGGIGGGSILSGFVGGNNGVSAAGQFPGGGGGGVGSAITTGEAGATGAIYIEY